MIERIRQFVALGIFGVLCCALLFGLGPSLSARLVLIGESVWDGYQELRYDPEVPECNLQELETKLASCPVDGAPSISNSPDEEVDPFADDAEVEEKDPFADDDEEVDPFASDEDVDPFAEGVEVKEKDPFADYDGDGDGDGEEGGVWELKIPASVGVKSGGETTAFREIVGFSNVVEALSMLDPPVNVEAVLSSTTFANFVTRRKKFVVEGVNVDCDFADFKGFGGIMELEILVEGSDDIADARRKIDDVAKKLKAEPLGESAGGKLETFLRNEADGPFLQTLIDNGVLT